jgi:L-alanine-DL-glutamate epimerase-like enolase superfamily enzyme
MTQPPDHYAALAELPLVVESYGAQRTELDVSSGFRRVTTTVVLRDGGHEGRGEDVTYAAEDHDGFPLDLPLAGTWTIDAFSERMGGLDLYPAGGPTTAGQETYRRWAFESAALDLALRQAGRSLGTALGLEYRPVRFVVSTRLDITPWLDVAPTLEFKLDPTPDWDADRVACVAASGRVRVLDFKSFYEGTPVDNPPDPAQYAMVARAFPDAVLEDPTLEGPARAALDGEELRFSFDAPIHSWGDVEAVAERAGLGTLPRFLNIKPSRFGSLRALLDCVARAQADGIVLYGGGQFELGIGRDHIQALASLLYADGANDVAPRDFHGEPNAGVPGSPLLPVAQGPGFGFAFAR